jgi:DNA modification methylase
MPRKSAKPPEGSRRAPARRGNSLDGKRWLQNSISVWSDLRKSPEELRLKHPAMFPAALAARLIESFIPEGRQTVLDPFTGIGSTLLAAAQLGKQGIGFELSPEFAAIARQRLQASTVKLHNASAADLLKHVPEGSIDLCVTSPPYWDILNQRRTADAKVIRHYGNLDDDLGTIGDYDRFLTALAKIFADVLRVLKPGAHCCVVVMDLRKKNKFYPFHSDLAAKLQQAGYEWDDLVIWNRQSEYNNLRPLGYPSVFRINKVHEFVLLMRKPA